MVPSSHDVERPAATDAGGTPGEPGRIRLLPSELVNQIAAGEVVERPASVVKELVENALDAGATRIRVEVRDGGARFLSVTDDGRGMGPDDVRMALQRHATSKLASSEDLERIASFGFRGEALPSIASVSRMRVLSRERGAETGFEVRLEGGRVAMEREAGCAVGTRIEVADLFSSVPARRKFLKKPGTEWGHISDWLARLSLALPGVHFEVQRDDKAALVWPACAAPRDRLAQVLPKRDVESLVEIEWEEAAGHLHAFASNPEHSRANGEGLYLYVNGRPVRDKLLRSGVTAAYRDILPRGRFPTVVAFVTVRPETVDVNVHPAKWEVRFADPQGVHALLRHGLREAMTSRKWLAERRASSVGPAGDGATAGRDGARGFHPDSPSTRPQSRTPAGGDRAGDEAVSDWMFAPGASDRVHDAPLTSETEAGAEGDASEGSGPRFGAMHHLGQIKASYIVLEGPNGLVLVDQHAAHERVLYEDLRSAWLANGVARQGLLTPINVELTPRAVQALAEASEAAEQLGFEIEGFGETAVVVRAIPALLSGRNPEALVRELSEEFCRAPIEAVGEADRVRLLGQIDRIFATLACHSARRFGDHLETDEQRAIVTGLDRIPWAPTCPHGRPVSIHLDLADIERRFGRR